MDVLKLSKFENSITKVDEFKMYSRYNLQIGGDGLNGKDKYLCLPMAGRKLERHIELFLRDL